MSDTPHSNSKHPSLISTFILGLNLSFTQGLRLHLKPRKVLIGIAVLLLLISVQVIMLLADHRMRHSATDVYVVFNAVMVLNLCLPFLSLITALGLLGGEIEQGTLVYLLIRPCPRLAILVGRTLAAAVVTHITLVFMFLSCLCAVRLVGRGNAAVLPPLPTVGLAMHLILVGGIGAWIFTSLYSALTLFCKRPLVALLLGLGHALAWEGIVAFLPGTIGGYTFTQNLRSLFFNYPTIGPWPHRVMFRDPQLVPPVNDALVFLIGCSIVFLLLAWYRFRGREIRPAE